MRAGQHGERLGIEMCFAGVHRYCFGCRSMVTGVFGYVRGQGLRGYSNFKGLFL
jgi:hypothetical protein